MLLGSWQIVRFGVFADASFVGAYGVLLLGCICKLVIITKQDCEKDYMMEFWFNSCGIVCVYIDFVLG